MNALALKLSLLAVMLPLALVVTLAVPGAAVAVCPTNSMSAPGASQVSPNPSGHLAGSRTCVEGGNIRHTATGNVSYDLTHGTISAYVDVQILCSGTSEMLTHDIFTLTGPASTSPISFSSVINVHSWADGVAFAGATVREGDSNISPGSVPGDWSTVGITITVGPGSSFDLYMDGRAAGGYWGNGGAAVNAWLDFPDLPAGYVVQSCQGFIAGGVVPVRAASWGKLKSLYR